MIEDFGNLPNRESVKRAAISNGNLKANIITYGASLQDLRLNGHAPSLILGFDHLQPYRDNAYFGAMVGRVANRISNGNFSLGDRQFQTDKNWLGKHTLHGGTNGIDRLNWNITDHTNKSVTLKVIDLESASGFPGDCNITCTYEITDDDSLKIEISATSTKDTICNIAHHSYFNLAGNGSALDHHLEIAAEKYLPVDEELLPTGQIADVHETDFDFTTSRAINANGFVDFDHNFCLSDKRHSIQEIATLTCHRSAIQMEISSTEPGLQFYTGGGLNIDAPGHDNNRYGPHSGIALEPQSWPDAVNQPDFPSTLLKKEETYRQTSVFKFKKLPR